MRRGKGQFLRANWRNLAGEGVVGKILSPERVASVGRGGGVAHLAETAALAERRASNRKVVKPCFDSRCGSAPSQCPWERHLILFPILGPSSLPVVVTQPDQRYANRTASVLEWYDRHRAYNIWFKRRRRQNANVLWFVLQSRKKSSKNNITVN